MHTACCPDNNLKRHRFSSNSQYTSGVVLKWFLVGFLILALPGRLLAQPTNPPDRDGLLKGLGMGLASIADRNNYPGPKHVLELKDDLNLTRDQVKKTEALDKVVSSSAVAKGEEIVQAEEELSKLFEAAAVSEKTLRSKLEEIGKLRAELRFIHLQAHLRMRQILTPDQLKKYSEIKGSESKLEN
jgi:Spy/CpxP family protein refolding chaperone